MAAVWRQTWEVVGSPRRLSFMRRPSVQRTAKLVRVQESRSTHDSADTSPLRTLPRWYQDLYDQPSGVMSLACGLRQWSWRSLSGRLRERSLQAS
jgi:hypothetical protein